MVDAEEGCWRSWGHAGGDGHRLGAVRTAECSRSAARSRDALRRARRCLGWGCGTDSRHEACGGGGVKVVVAGSSGLIGSALVTSLQADDHDVVTLVRREPRGATRCSGTRRSALGGTTSRCARRSTAPARWSTSPAPVWPTSAGTTPTSARSSTPASRPRPASPPRSPRAAHRRVLVSGSASGYYGDTGPEGVDESAHAGRPSSRTSASLGARGRAGPRGGRPRRPPAHRTVADPDGGAFGRWLPILRLGGGGPLGSGKQWWSLISLTDEVGAIRHAIDHESIVGPANLSAPEQITNGDLTTALGRALHRPSLVPAPMFGLRCARRVRGRARHRPADGPERAERTGYEFCAPHDRVDRRRHPGLSAAATTSAMRHRVGDRRAPASPSTAPPARAGSSYRPAPRRRPYAGRAPPAARGRRVGATALAPRARSRRPRSGRRPRRSCAPAPVGDDAAPVTQARSASRPAGAPTASGVEGEHPSQPASGRRPAGTGLEWCPAVRCRWRAAAWGGRASMHRRGRPPRLGGPTPTASTATPGRHDSTRRLVRPERDRSLEPVAASGGARRARPASLAGCAADREPGSRSAAPVGRRDGGRRRGGLLPQRVEQALGPAAGAQEVEQLGGVGPQLGIGVGGAQGREHQRPRGSPAAEQEAHEVADCRDVGLRRRPVEPAGACAPGEPGPREHHRPVRCHQHVAGVHPAVRETRAMQRDESLGHRGRSREHVAGAQRAASAYDVERTAPSGTRCTSTTPSADDDQRTSGASVGASTSPRRSRSRASAGTASGRGTGAVRSTVGWGSGSVLRVMASRCPSAAHPRWRRPQGSGWGPDALPTRTYAPRGCVAAAGEPGRSSGDTAARARGRRRRRGGRPRRPGRRPSPRGARPHVRGARGVGRRRRAHAQRRRRRRHGRPRLPAAQPGLPRGRRACSTSTRWHLRPFTAGVLLAGADGRRPVVADPRRTPSALASTVRSTPGSRLRAAALRGVRRRRGLPAASRGSRTASTPPSGRRCGRSARSPSACSRRSCRECCSTTRARPRGGSSSSCCGRSCAARRRCRRPGWARSRCSSRAGSTCGCRPPCGR